MGMGQQINTFMPYMMPQGPLFMGQAQFNMPQFNMSQIPFGGMSLPFGISSAKSETPEEAEKRRKKEQAERDAAEFAKRLEAIKQQQANAEKLQAQIQDIENAKKDLDTTIQKAKSGSVSEDGTIKVNETWKDYNKLPGWKKVLRAGGQILQGTAKLAMSFVGYETDEKTGEYKWNWKKGLLNGAIAVGCGILCACTAPISLPLIGATTVGTAVTGGLLATGAVCGVAGVGKGIYNAVKAEDTGNPEDLDKAFQDIGAGLAISAASVMGARSLGASLESTAGANSAATAVRNSGNSFFKGVDFLTKNEYAKGSNKATTFIKDATVNAFRKMAQNGQEARLSYETSGLLKSWGDNIIAMIPKLGKSKFEKAGYETNQKINTRLNEINNELNSSGINPMKKALLEREQLVLEAQKTELRGAITKDSWKNIANNSKLRTETSELQSLAKNIQSNGSVEINGTTFNSSGENIKALQEAVNKSKELSKQIETLAKVRSKTIKKMSYFKKYASEVEAYTEKTRTNRFARIYDTAFSKSDITWKSALLSPFKAIWSYMNIPFKIWGYADKNGSNGIYKIQETVLPTYEAGMLDSFLGFGKQTLTTKIAQQNENGETVEQEIAVTKDVLAQLEEQKRQLDEAIIKVQTEMNKVYTA